MITVAVEGDTDVPFVVSLCKASGFEVIPRFYGRRGKDDLRELIPGYARAGAGAPHLVVRDLDRDATCAPSWIRDNAPKRPGRFFALRLAVRAVEAWFLADLETASACLRVSKRELPNNPDDEDDPKRSIVNLARRSSSVAIRKAIVPGPGASRKAGPGYEAWLLDAASGWSIDRALTRSPSLARAHARLNAIGAAWAAVQNGDGAPASARRK